MKRLFIATIFIFIAAQVRGQSEFVFMPFFQQSGIYYSSERVTAYGYGFGIGCGVKYKAHGVAQADVNLLWGNGNTVASRIAVGYQLKGPWSPAVYLTSTFIAGHKTEVLNDQGELPPSVVWAVGLRIAPFRYEGERGILSVLELGYGFGADGGKCLEATILSMGFKF